MSLETFSKKRIEIIINTWLEQYDESVCFAVEELQGNDDYGFKLTLLAIDKNTTYESSD